MPEVSIVSADGHAVMPAEMWPDYLESRFHDQLPRFEAEDALNARAMLPLNDVVLGPVLDLVDTEGAYRSGGWTGAWDADVRLAEMDREGIAAEIVHHGFFRVPDLGFSVMSATYPDEVVDAGVRAHDRWAHDTFGGAPDRLLLVGSIGACTDLDATIAEVEWVADHGFVGTYAPGFNGLPELPPLYDPYWDRVWATYADTGLVPIVHGGYGLDQGVACHAIERSLQAVSERDGSELDLIMELAKDFNEDFVVDLRCRRAMVQLMLGGVFDRHPGLKLAMVEVRADWLPEALEMLDAVYHEHRRDLPTNRAPSEWWASNCIAGLSFMHSAEVEMRHQIGEDNMAFGRDYPHTEGTWPNTDDYLKLVLSGVSKDTARKILGENAIRFFDLDRPALAAVAARIGPDLDAIVDPGATVDPALVEHLAMRCGVLKPPEGALRNDRLSVLVAEDVDRIGSLTSR